MHTSTLTNWQYRQSGKSEWKNSRPGATTEIHPDLLYNNEISDPFIDMNEKQVQWIGETNWEYRTTFKASSASFKNNVLVFEGLDTFAKVYLNNTPILTTENMFREYRVDITQYLKPDNELLIEFESGIVKARQLEKEAGLGKLASFNGGSERLHARKAQYHYGWDWGPVLITCGPYKPVKFISYDTLIKDVYVKVDVDNLTVAKIDIQTELETDAPTKLDYIILDPEGAVIEEFTQDVSESATVSKKVTINNPQLWYPFSHGEQPLYTVQVSTTSQTITKRIGIRKVELIQESLIDQSGSSFYFKINNVPVYSTGSNWIPAHSFQTSLTAKDYSEWLQLAVNGHQNMIRIWGGGYYEQDIFYEECDRLGIMVWQDFMFACGQYPGDAKFIANVAAEAEHQLKRLRNHCCLTIYAGNNEDYQVAEQCGLEWDPSDLSGDYSHTTFPARTIYENTLPKLVQKLQSDVPYHPGSPWGGDGTADPTIGDMHQWNVWHGSQEKYQNWYKLGGRFVSEFGMEALPNRKTYEQCITDSTELYPQSETVDHHNKADGFERRLALYVIENIKVQGLDFDSWIYATQLMQAECLGYAYRCWRREWRGDGKRYNGGTIVWQINDCWPVASWSLVDFYRRPKLAYYSVKRESKPVGVGIYRYEKRDGEIVEDAKFGAAFDYRPKTFSVDIWGVNANTEDLPATLKVDIYEVATGEKLKSLPDQEVVLTGNSTTEVIKDLDIPSDKHVVVHGYFVSKGEVIASAGDWPQPLKYLKFNDRKVDFKVEDGSVSLSSDKPIKGVEILVDRDVFLQDNGFDLFPGQVHKVEAPQLKKSDKVGVRYYK
ncbi:beta-mannosidase precursor [Spathaspora passalidarum NRRL Y-27907]|uniref:Beta-mannosidase B n=1 Tax=Spathaspora passalidarum (strain NRRL Y-27907 / 11-Y1) TaxID=619300 RepID=G3AIA6_SPAPN|nr:beta-mannosidase precursor [Spathaspora passalidarum NRRL Y-27907]EGW33675.1 beta-mannosidase precursor [Spathaspora passalidarum NRRL Y-27907]